VLAQDGDVAHLTVAASQLVVGQPDGARIVSALGLFQCAALQRDGAGVVSAGPGEPAVQPPQRRKAAGRDRLAERIRRASQDCGGLIEIILQQGGLCQHRAHRQLVVAGQRGAEHGRQHLGGFGAVAALELGARARDERVQG